MKKGIYALILLLVVVSGIVLAKSEMKGETSKKSTPEPVSAAKKETVAKKWEETPAGIKYKEWEESPAGKKVYAGEAKIRKHLKDFTSMEATITSLSLPSGSRLGFGVMVSIEGVDYILRFDTEKSQLELLRSLKVDDKIILKSRNVSHAPKYEYPIISAGYVERDGKEIYNRIPPKDGC